MKEVTQESYIKRIDRVIAYLVAHLDQNLDLNRLAAEAHLSPYHFHRIYVAMVGETVADTVRRVRLQRAAALLLSTRKPLPQIARVSGYGSVQAFSRAFRNTFDIAPATYRRRGGINIEPPRAIDPFTEGNISHEVSVEEATPITATALRHVGAYAAIDQAFERIANWAVGKRYMGRRSRVFGVFYDDPTLIHTSKLRADACISSSQTMEVETPFHLTQIPSGRCAALTHTGPYAGVNGLYDWLIGSWLPANNEFPDDQPCFLEHLDNPRITPPAQVRTKLYVPLKG